jgi:MYXO-CTERM domain-containing protein
VSVDTWLARSSIDVPVRSDARPRSRATDLALALGVLVAVVAAAIPLLRVVDPSWWVLGVVVIAASVLAAGFAARRFRLPGVAVAVIEAAVWVLVMTAMFAGPTAILWVLPSPASFQLVPNLVTTAMEDIALGAAPLEAGHALSFFIVGAVGALALVIDHVVLTARMPLLAAIGLVAISLVPSIAVPGDIDLAAFVLLAGSILFLLRTDTRAKQRGDAAPRASSTVAGSGGAAATAVGIGAIAVVVAVVATPLLPAPLIRANSGGIGAGASIDPTLELGDDLRQPREVEVLTVRSTASSAPYLRAVTLSGFNGSVWQPDDSRTLPVEDGAGFVDLEVAEDIEVAEHTTTVEIIDLDSPWLPVPYPATAVSDLEGDWGTLPDNRTVVSRSTTTQGQSYEVTTAVPRPTLEQIRGSEATGGDEDTLSLPDEMPTVIGDSAREITANAQNDYDALLSLQSWFRGPEFDYSLEAPVEDGFDGSGADAVAGFLAEREGYCVHFASAFALMARSLEMPARIVVGYLPGSSTGTQTDGQSVYSVMSGQLHAWPEVHFAGIGWVPFEPTNSLGVPTSFSSAATTSGGTAAGEAPQQGAQPSAAPTPSASTGDRPEDEAAGGTGDATTGGGAAPPAVGIGLLVLLALIAPAVLRQIRRRQALTAAGGGDATAAWAAVQDAALDLRIAVPGAESPRVFGDRLVTEHGAPAEAMGRLVRAIETASYADDPARRRTAFGQGQELVDAVTAVQAGLNASAGFWRKGAAVLAPRSLVVRPGSAYAAPRLRRERAASVSS